jgi:two-component system, OmpR family, response regulator MprA
MADGVVVADDDRAIRESLVRAVGLEGYEVVVVDDEPKLIHTVRGAGYTVPAP